jgi:predicted dehydrogenase
MDQVRYGIIGCGHMALEHLADIRALEGTSVVAGADPDAGSRARFASAAGDVVMFEDHAALLESGLCDAVVVAAPNHRHREILLDVARYPLHVLSEKPLCITVDECRQVIDAFAASDRVVWMGLEYRYKPSIARLLEDVATGEVGDVVMVSIREHRYPFLHKVGAWNRFRAQSGGTLVEKCCHFFDLMNLITRARPTRVMASGAQDVLYKDETYAGRTPDIIDNALVIVDFEGGARGLLDLSMFTESGPWEQEIAVTGSRGKAEAFIPIDAADGFGRIRVGKRERGVVVDEEVFVDDVAHMGYHSGADYLEHVGFLEAIRTGSPAEVTFEEGMWAVAVGQAAHRSIDEGRVVAMDEVL